jgi:uncharacterized protein YajQ (UPF0234 family)
MADQFSFDVVSEVNMQELKNALDQATKEIKQRFDFKDSKTEITLKEKEKELVVSENCLPPGLNIQCAGYFTCWMAQAA